MRSRLVLLLALASCKEPERQSGPDSLGVQSPPRGLEILSPRTGDTLVEGRTYTIRWVSLPGTRINLGAAMGGKDKGLLLTDASPGLDSLVWTVPVGFVTGFGPASSNQIRLRLENADSTTQWVETGPFVITGAPRE